MPPVRRRPPTTRAPLPTARATQSSVRGSSITWCLVCAVAMGDVTRSAERVPELGMAAWEPIGEGPAAGGEGDAGPGDLGGRERGDLDRLRIGSEASAHHVSLERDHDDRGLQARIEPDDLAGLNVQAGLLQRLADGALCDRLVDLQEAAGRSEEHTSELQSRGHLVCRLL